MFFLLNCFGTYDLIFLLIVLVIFLIFSICYLFFFKKHLNLYLRYFYKKIDLIITDIINYFKLLFCWYFFYVSFVVLNCFCYIFFDILILVEYVVHSNYILAFGGWFLNFHFGQVACSVCKDQDPEWTQPMLAYIVDTQCTCSCSCKVNHGVIAFTVINAACPINCGAVFDGLYYIIYLNNVGCDCGCLDCMCTLQNEYREEMLKPNYVEIINLMCNCTCNCNCNSRLRYIDRIVVDDVFLDQYSYIVSKNMELLDGVRLRDGLLIHYANNRCCLCNCGCDCTIGCIIPEHLCLSVRLISDAKLDKPVPYYWCFKQILDIQLPKCFPVKEDFGWGYFVKNFWHYLSFLLHLLIYTGRP